MAELRSHVHDLRHPHHDRDRRSIICFPPEELRSINIAAIRVMPSGRYTIHHIESTMQSDRWAYLLSYRGHMRMAVPECGAGHELVIANANSVSRPVGWRYLAQLGGTEVTIRRKALLKCPHCQCAAVRLPPGIEGAIVGKSLLLTDVELRSFQIKQPWAESTATDHGPEAREAWMREARTPPLDVPPKLPAKAEEALVQLLKLVPDEDAPFDYDTWKQVALATDEPLKQVGALSVAANAYTCRWRSTRMPTTLTHAGLEVFEGYVEDTVLHYAKDLANFGVKPLADKPPPPPQPPKGVRDRGGQPDADSRRPLGGPGERAPDGVHIGV